MKYDTVIKCKHAINKILNEHNANHVFSGNLKTILARELLTAFNSGYNECEREFIDVEHDYHMGNMVVLELKELVTLLYNKIDKLDETNNDETAELGKTRVNIKC